MVIWGLADEVAYSQVGLHHFTDGKEDHGDDETEDQEVDGSNEGDCLCDRLVVRSDIVHCKVDRLDDRRGSLCQEVDRSLIPRVLL